MNFNNNSDQPLMPNQASVGPEYIIPMDGAPGNTVIRRKGVVTLVKLSGNLTASRQISFSPTDPWLPGDEVFIACPTHTGANDTIEVNSISGVTLTTWPALLANGGHFVFGQVTYALQQGQTGDFTAVDPGQSTT